MFHSKARWAFHLNKKRRNKKKIHKLLQFLKHPGGLVRPSMVPSVFPRQLAFTCTLRLKTYIKVSLYIYIFIYIYSYVYIYIKKG